MHEYTIANSIVEAVNNNLEGELGVTVKEVHLVKGELRILSEQALKSAYEMLTEDTDLEGSQLIIEEIKTVIHCNSCGYQGEVNYHHDRQYHFSVPILECPKCGSPAEITEGKELDLVQLVVEEEDNGNEDSED